MNTFVSALPDEGAHLIQLYGLDLSDYDELMLNQLQEIRDDLATRGFSLELHSRTIQVVRTDFQMEQAYKSHTEFGCI